MSYDYKKYKKYKILKLLRDTSKQITENSDEWIKFLNTASNMYKYSSLNQILIYAQNPNAIACTDLSTWNKIGKWINKGSKSIAIINNSDDLYNSDLKYIFDISNTSDKRDIDKKDIKKYYIWNISNNYNHIINKFKNFCGYKDNKETIVKNEDEFAKEIIAVIDNVINNTYNSEFYNSISNYINNTNLEKLSNTQIQEIFKDILISSCQYMVLKRCSVKNPEKYIDINKFNNINLFNTRRALNSLQNQINSFSYVFLAYIGREVKSLQLNKNIENNKKVLYNENIKFINLKRESIRGINNEEQQNSTSSNIGGRTEIRQGNIGSDNVLGRRRTIRPRQQEGRDNLYRDRWNTLSEPDNGGVGRERGNGTRRISKQVWENEREISQGREKNGLFEDDRRRHSHETSDADTEGSFGNGRLLDTTSEEKVQYNRRTENGKSVEMGTGNELNNVADRRDNKKRNNLRITNSENEIANISLDEYTTEQQKAEDNNTSAFSILEENQKVNISEDNININNDINNDIYIDINNDIKDDINNIHNFQLDVDIFNQNRNLPIKERFNNNINAIKTLKLIEEENRYATSAEQEILSKYIGWGGISEVFDDTKSNWKNEYNTLKSLLNADEYEQARASTLNAHYTPPELINTIYKVIEKSGFEKGKILEPSMGIGNFFGLLPEKFKNSELYGVELDSITGRIAKQLYPTANIQINGFEKTTFKDNYFDIAIGNVPFGNYQIVDKNNVEYKNFLIHDYFFAKTLDKVHNGGIIAFITSKGTLDKENSSIREYIANKADLIGAIRLPNNAFKNANTEVTTDIIFLQKHENPPEIMPDWVHLGSINNIPVNKYFEDNPHMILGNMELKSGQFGMETTCTPKDDMSLDEQLNIAIQNINITFNNINNDINIDINNNINTDIIIDNKNLRNFSYVLNNNKLYFYENNELKEPQFSNQKTVERITKLILLRDSLRHIIDMQFNECSDIELQQEQLKLNTIYDEFVNEFGLINNRANKSAFLEDVSYPLLCSLENLDENGNLLSKADIFTKRTIKQTSKIDKVNTPMEALAVSISEKACVDIRFMSTLIDNYDTDYIIDNLNSKGIIFKNPLSADSNKFIGWETADEYLSGNVRQKLEIAKEKAIYNPQYNINVEYLEKVQPTLVKSSEIDIIMGATWIEPRYYEEFMFELLNTPNIYKNSIHVLYSSQTNTWRIEGKSVDNSNPSVINVYGTKRISAYSIIERILNLKSIKIFDKSTIDGKEVSVLNIKETTIAQQKQELIQEEFKNWIFKDIERRNYLTEKYNKLFNSIRPREFDGKYISFNGINPEITLRHYQRNAVARTLYGNSNTLLAHCVGAGKTFTMIASAMESKRIGLCHKSLFVVPNHLTEQMGSDIYKLYPGAKVLVATKKDFEPLNRKKFCSRIATGDFDIVVIGHTQFNKIPISPERQITEIKNQIEEITQELTYLKFERNEKFSTKQLEKTKKMLQKRLSDLISSDKDDVINFEELGIDRLYVDEAHNFKNLFMYTKMNNVAGIPSSNSNSLKATDMFLKCRYIDEITGGKGIVFATGTPISNTMVDLYTMMRYLQYNLLEEIGLKYFDNWASSFGQTVTGVELAPEGTTFRLKTRFSKFFNLPELIKLWKESTDIQTADMLNLPKPKAIYKTIVTKPTSIQKDMLLDISNRAEKVRNKEVDISVDNMLKITSDGRKLALDQRIINPLFPDDENSKLNICINNIYDIYLKNSENKGTQLIFCDSSTPKSSEGVFNVYDDIKEKLINKGIKDDQIAFIHDANSENQKAELFAKVRSGKVRILLGSTQKCGAGTNIQDRLVALHHLDCPWRPSDLEQREGRILRYGNRNPEVFIFRYVTENTFDAYNWSIVETKQKFISQIMTSKTPMRSMEDIDETALSYAEVKETIELMKKDCSILNNNIISEDNFNINIDGTNYNKRKDAGNALYNLCKSYNQEYGKLCVGNYRGFDLYLYTQSSDFKIDIKNNLVYTVTLENSEVGNIVRINNVINSIEDKLEANIQKLENLKKQKSYVENEVKKPFPKEKEYKEKVKRLSILNSELSELNENNKNNNKNIQLER